MSLKFGTSGVRGLNSEFKPDVIKHYVNAFITYARTKIHVHSVALGGDLRESTPGIMYLVKDALKDLNCEVLDCGELPTPALALYCAHKNALGIMITGSHIPADRNGIKFYWPWGEILKEDELAIADQFAELSKQKIRADENHHELEARHLYIQRYIRFFSPYRSYFQGKLIIVYQHSTVTRDLWKPILTELGFMVREVGRSALFVPVDTETAEASITINKMIQEMQINHFFAIVSSDGDGDRPFLCDEKLQMIRGDTIGILSASFLKAHFVSTPISTNTALEKSQCVKKIVRTKIGSPFVIAGMAQDGESKTSVKSNSLSSSRGDQENNNIVVGFEANGGLLLGSDIKINDVELKKLPTRDSLLPVLCCLAQACERSMSLSTLVSTLPQRFTESDVLRDFPIEKKNQIYHEILEGNSFKEKIISKYGNIKETNELDGLRITFESEDILHFRPSGNAPEFRCYAEAQTVEGAKALVQEGIEWLHHFR